MYCLGKISRCLSVIIIFFLLSFLTTGVILAQAQESGKEKEEKPVRVKTEEILVTATAEKEKPLASVFVIQPVVLDLFKTKNISEVLSFAPGTYVTTGGKAEAHVKIRGIDNDKSTLLLDGIPIFEPYFNMYDLKTVPSLDVEYAQVTKGPSSVLYGANTLGGIIEILTRRPEENCLELSTRMGPLSSFNFAGSGTYVAPRFALKLSAAHEESDGYKIRESETAQPLSNSDYRNNSFGGKFYYFPGQNSEILFQASFYDSEYGVPPATAYYSPRYWRFKDWHRLTLGLGGTFTIFKTGTLKIRTYYVNYYNVLDAYTDATFGSILWESIYKNYSAGAFILGTIHPASSHELRFSLNGRLDKVKQQGSATDPWEHYEHQVYSFGLEDEWKITRQWHLIGGISLDYLDKQSGGNRTSLNPIVGLKFLPAEYLEVHLSYSMKSRFPSMRSLYSPTSGNPDLRDEMGRTFEFGTSYSGWIDTSLAVFTSKYQDLIDSIRRPDGTRQYINIGEAKISGFEIEAGKSLGHFNVQIQYTFLEAKNITDDRKLDLVPESQASLILSYLKPDNFSLAFWVLGASGAETIISQNIVTVPDYATANLTLEKFLSSGSFFLKVENLFNKAYYTEPGYPVTLRRIEAGFRFRTGL